MTADIFFKKPPQVIGLFKLQKFGLQGLEYLYINNYQLKMLVTHKIATISLLHILLLCKYSMVISFDDALTVNSPGFLTVSCLDGFVHTILVNTCKCM